jgi:hypothetical protein
MIYLASPYSHPDPALRERRFEAACRATAALVCRPGSVRPGRPQPPPGGLRPANGWDFWEWIDRHFLERCDEVVVLTVDGWRESAGVQAEVRIAGELGKPVRYVAPE